MKIPKPAACPCGGCSCGCGKCHSVCDQEKTDKVEGFIREIARHAANSDWDLFRGELRALIALVREEK